MGLGEAAPESGATFPESGMSAANYTASSIHNITEAKFHQYLALITSKLSTQDKTNIRYSLLIKHTKELASPLRDSSALLR